MSGPGASGAEVDSVAASVFTVPTEDDPEQDGTLTWSSTTAVVVEATAGGESGTGWTYATPAAATFVHDVLAPVVRGTPAVDTRRAWTRMHMAMRNLGTGGLAAYALSAVDTALWDLKARLLGCSLVDLLGATRDEVPVYGSGGFTSLDDARMAEQIRSWVDGGMTQVKIKVGRHPEEDERRLSTARDAAGDDVALFVDANGGYQRHEALHWVEVFAAAGVTWLEEPLTSDDLDGMRLVRDRSPGGVAITSGEYVDGLPAARRLLDAGAVDVLQLDATRCGGLTGFLDAEALARSHHVPTSAHCAPSMHVAVCAAAPSLQHLEWFHDHVRVEERLFAGVPSARGGAVVVDRTPLGHGLSLRPEADRYRASIDDAGRGS